MASQEINFSKFDFSTKANKTYLSFLLEILGAWFRNCGSLAIASHHNSQLWCDFHSGVRPHRNRIRQF
jgi:hypothetical protein